MADYTVISLVAFLSFFLGTQLRSHALLHSIDAHRCSLFKARKQLGWRSYLEVTSFLLYDHLNPTVVQRHRHSPSTIRVGDANRQSGGLAPHIFCAARRGGCCP